MRIAYIITRSDEIGGAHVHVRDLSKWMAEQGHEVCVLVGGHGLFVDALRENGTTVFIISELKRPISLKLDILALKQVTQVLREWQPDIVSSHSAKAGTIARIACWRLKLPCLFTAHGWTFKEGTTAKQGIIYLAIEKAMTPLSSAIITVCESDNILAREKGLVPKGPLRTIHNGMPDISATLMAEPGRAGNIKIVMIARFDWPKDHETFFQALSKLLQYEWQVDLVGDGPDYFSARQRVQELGLEQRINFLGRLSDVTEVLSRASIFVLTSIWEGFPRSILEAMRAGLPVVGSDVGGISESIINGENGWTVPAQQVVPLTNRLEQLITNDKTREAMGVASRKLFVERFQFRDTARKTESLYKEVLGSGSTHK